MDKWEWEKAPCRTPRMCNQQQQQFCVIMVKNTRQIAREGHVLWRQFKSKHAGLTPGEQSMLIVITYEKITMCFKPSGHLWENHFIMK